MKCLLNPENLIQSLKKVIQTTQLQRLITGKTKPFADTKKSTFVSETQKLKQLLSPLRSAHALRSQIPSPILR